MGALALTASLTLDRPLVDPEGFLGPSWLRLPLLILGAFLLDILPRTLWVSRMRPAADARHGAGAGARPLGPRADHAGRGRPGALLHHLRQLPEPQVVPALHHGRGQVRPRAAPHRPGPPLRPRAGHRAARHLRHRHLARTSCPRSTCGSCRWSRWRSPPGWCGRATSPSATGSPPRSAWPGRSAPRPTTPCPTLGPGFQYSYLYTDLARHRVERADGGVVLRAQGVLRDGAVGSVQSVAGFARLHVAITLLVALMVQYTLRNRILHIVFWTNFAITVVATLYFGWHYIADDIAGVVDRPLRLLARRARERAEVRQTRACRRTRRRPPRRSPSTPTDPS